MDFSATPVIDPSAAGVVPPEMWPEYSNIALPVPICEREQVGKGVRWSLWPLCFEIYTGDEEPDLANARHGRLARNRLVMWRRISRQEVPAGWHQTLRKRPWRVDAITKLTDKDYRSSWSKDAVRNLHYWQKKHLNKTHEIVDLPFARYVELYKKSITRKRTGLDLLHGLERQHADPQVQPHLVCWGVRNKHSGAIIAGICVLYSPTERSSIRICPFMYDEARGVHAMTGLMDHWFMQSARRGMHTQFFTHFWHPGEPKSWKGFSIFKSHFVEHYLVYPPLLWRFVPGRIF